MASSFNAYGSSNLEANGNVPVWLGVVSPLPIGASLKNVYEGMLVPAGSPMALDSDGYAYPVFTYTIDSVASTVYTIVPNGAYGSYVPQVGEYLVRYASASSKTAQAITAVTANSDGSFDVTVGSAISGAAADTVIAVVGANAFPSAYLYNDIYMDDIDVSANAGATAALVVAHNEGILIDRTPSAGLASVMAGLVPNVIQVNG